MLTPSPYDPQSTDEQSFPDDGSLEAPSLDLGPDEGEQRFAASWSVLERAPVGPVALLALSVALLGAAFLYW